MTGAPVWRLFNLASVPEWFRSILIEAVRIRIRRLTGGVIDGVRMSQLLPGFTYEIRESVAAHLIAIGAAIEVPSAKPDAVIPLDEDDTPPVFGGVIVTQPRDRAADKPDRKPARKRKR